MKILLVTAHPRRNSLTESVAAAFEEAARANGHMIERADLMAEGFDPVMRESDEPDWSNPAKGYSEPVCSEMARIDRNDATVMVFPVWWWTMPALLKGWIDRVWNFGYAYGGRSYPHGRVWMIALAGNPEASFAEQGHDAAMRLQLETGILRYCRVKDARLFTFYDALEGEPHPARIIAQGRQLGSDF